VSRAGKSRWLAPLALAVGLLAIWQIAASWGLLADALSIKSFLVPSPSEIANSLWLDRSLLGSAALTTLVEVVAGFAIAVVAGVGLALLIHRSDSARRAIYPLLVGSQTIPIIAIAPILVVWFGFGLGPKLAIIALVCFFPITVNCMDGLRRSDLEQIRLVRSLGASKGQVLSWVEVPTALPSFFSGAKIAAAVSVIGAVFAEWSGSDAGLGYLIQISSAQLLTARMFAAIVVLSGIAIALFWAVGAIERRIVFWQQPEGGR
jgi:NitT/TauT family transport system permease protein/putative hydroxymethylpyrimidine transport system permease protein